jgi:hypothetical protein
MLNFPDCSVTLTFGQVKNISMFMVVNLRRITDVKTWALDGSPRMLGLRVFPDFKGLPVLQVSLSLAVDMFRKVRGYVEDCCMQTVTVAVSISSGAQDL